MLSILFELGQEGQKNQGEVTNKSMYHIMHVVAMTLSQESNFTQVVAAVGLEFHNYETSQDCWIYDACFYDSAVVSREAQG